MKRFHELAWVYSGTSRYLKENGKTMATAEIEKKTHTHTNVFLSFALCIG